MKRHAGLHALSQHHHFALTQALEMRLATEAPASQRPAALRAAAETFLRFWEQAGQQHFREEEEILLPAYGQHTRLDHDPAVARLLAEHAQIRARVQALAASLEASTVSEEAVAALGQALHDHVRFEENEVFPRMEATLGEADLLALGRRLTPLHAKKSCEA